MRIEVTPQDIVASRFAISPLIETMHAQWVLEGTHAAGVHRAWAERRGDDYRRLAASHPGLRAALVVSGNRGSANVDFIAPPPAGLSVPFERELAAMRATPVERAHAEVTQVLSQLPPVAPAMRELLLGPDVVEVLADGFAALWTEIVEPEWPRLHAILEREVVHRAGQLATYGWAVALDDLSPRVSWNPAGWIECEMSHLDDALHRLGGRGLLFLPSSFCPAVGTYLDDAWPYALVYPARGVGAGIPAAAPGLGRLIGRTRARILTELATPATTTHLAALLGHSLGTTGEHLAALREAGLVTGSRSGRHVLYVRTPLGDSLVTG
ncbi:MAG: winged helix-turn-helix transcriptional regulator [Nonomuraea sp.]|nr:winged helix-turn-helix transcriptional regulator [Nonomuraea sp.]